MIRTLLAMCLCLPVLPLAAQPAPDAICKEGDCPERIFDIQLDESTLPPIPSQKRTDRFKQAYVNFRTIRNSSYANLDWREKYDAFQLGGESCLRYYQLESAFGQEFLDNPDFKAFVEKDDPAAARQIVRNGFRSSRRGINLARRMESQCPERVRSTEKKGGTPVTDTKREYQDLGLALGYFDEKGQMLKDLKPPKAYKPRNKMSKKQRVENLQDKIAQLPVGNPAQQKVARLTNDLKAARPKFEGLKNFLSAFSPLVAAFLPNPAGLLSSVGKIGDLLGNLLNVKLKFPKLGLFDKIKGLFGRGKKLKDQAQNLVDEGKKLDNRAQDFANQVDKLGDKLNERDQNAGDLAQTLAELDQKKKELLEKLADQPKKIIDQLEEEVAKLEDRARKFQDQLEDEEDRKDKILEKLADLEKEKQDLEDRLRDLEATNEDLQTQADELQEATQAVEEEVKAAQEEENQLDAVLDQLTQLPEETALDDQLKICEDDLKKIYDRYVPISEAQTVLNEKMDQVKKWPGRLLDKLKGIKLFQKDLKAGKDGTPPAGRALDKLDELSDKATAIGSIVEILTGKKSELQEKVEALDGRIDQAKDLYDQRNTAIDQLKDEAVALLLQKSGLQDKIDQATGTASDLTQDINQLLDRFRLFEDQSRCVDLQDLLDKLKDIEAEQTTTEKEVEELEHECEQNEAQQEELETETKAVEQEIEEEAEQAEVLAEEEKVLQEQLGEDVKLEPVTPQEWSEDFEVERDYWKAVFHPDDEVVEGYRGRYFQVQLKDASKKVKLLFGPGEYYMDKGDFRDNYGSVIGAFVTEALHALRKAERDGIKLFVQGSADITGQKTFKGNLDGKFMYDRFSVLPIKGDSDRFESEAEEVTISTKGFGNEDLPNLRGNFLREMISIYSRKLEPILLEGSVTDEVDKDDRNAVIYLFIPESLVDDYSRF